MQQEATKGASLFLTLLGSILVSYPGIIALILRKLIHQMVKLEPIFLFHRFSTRLGAFLRKPTQQKLLCYWRQTMHIHPGLLLKRGISHPGVVVVEVRPLNPYIALGRPIGLSVLGVLTHPIPIGILISLRLIVSIRNVLIQYLCRLMAHQTYRFLNLAFIGKVTRGL